MPNANLISTIVLTGNGFEHTLVEMHVDPELTSNIHDQAVKGKFGEFYVGISGKRISATSPSSRIVALEAWPRPRWAQTSPLFELAC